MEEDWVFDSLVCFLNGPVWNAPLQSFIEEKSLIFEPNVTENEDYEKIFNEYRNLVDLMLGSYMEDIGITPQQFEEACITGHQDMLPRHFDQNLFEQIWAANDYEMFKRMMTQRNVELQLQALELIEQKYGVTPQSFVPHKKQQHVSGETTAEILYKGEKPSPDLEQQIMEDVIKKFPSDDNENSNSELSSTNEEVKYLLEEKEILHEQLKMAIESIASPQKEKTTIEEKPSTPKHDLADTKKSTGAILKKIITPEIEKPTQEIIDFDKKPISTEIDSIELKKRQEYLRAQRDKLVALKKEARKKQLDVESNTSEKTKIRPKSAKAAEAALSGTPANVDPQQLQIRKALAERLRSEVISNKPEF